MIIQNNQQNSSQDSQNILSMKDLARGERIRKVTTHEQVFRYVSLFELVNNEGKYVAKMFKPEKHHNFMHELYALRELNHPNIVEVLYSQTCSNESMSSWKGDMLVFKYAEHGSLNEYIPLNGKLNEDTTRVIFVQMMSALKYAANKEPKGFVHPNFLPSNILLDSQRNVKICGWSQQPQNKQKKDLIKDLLFSCCQILILMLTGYMPFFKKDPKMDPLYRYINKEYIGKFWQHFERRASLKHKEFKFSDSLKEMIQKVFLEQWTTFDQVESCAWMKKPLISHSEYTKILSTQQGSSQSKRQQLQKKHSQRSEQKKRILQKYEQQTLHGSSNRSSGEYDIFIQDYYDNSFNKHDVPASQCSELIRLYDDRPNFVVASLKEHLRNVEEQDTDWIFGGEFALQSYNFHKDGNQIYLKFVFVQNSQVLIEREEDLQITVKVLIRLFKDPKNHLFASVQIFESTLNEFYSSQIMRYIEDTLRLHPS